LTTNSFVVRCFDHHPCLVYQQGAEPFLRERLLLFRLEKTRPELSYLRASASGSRLPIKLVVFPPAEPPSALFVAVYKSMGSDCQQGIHVSFLMEEAAIMHVDVKLPLVV